MKTQQLLVARHQCCVSQPRISNNFSATLRQVDRVTCAPQLLPLLSTSGPDSLITSNCKSSSVTSPHCAVHQTTVDFPLLSHAFYTPHRPVFSCLRAVLATVGPGQASECSRDCVLEVTGQCTAAEINSHTLIQCANKKYVHLVYLSSIICINNKWNRDWFYKYSFKFKAEPRFPWKESKMWVVGRKLRKYFCGHPVHSTFLMVLILVDSREVD